MFLVKFKTYFSFSIATLENVVSESLPLFIQYVLSASFDPEANIAEFETLSE